MDRRVRRGALEVDRSRHQVGLLLIAIFLLWLVTAQVIYV